MFIKLEDLIPLKKQTSQQKKDINKYELEKNIRVDMDYINNKLNESKVGDIYINIGEIIEEIELKYKQLEKLIKPMKLKSDSIENKILYKLGNAIMDLKSAFGDYYGF